MTNIHQLLNESFGYTTTSASDINDSGALVGLGDNDAREQQMGPWLVIHKYKAGRPTGRQAFRLFELFPTLPHSRARGVAINNRNQVAIMLDENHLYVGDVETKGLQDLGVIEMDEGVATLKGISDDGTVLCVLNDKFPQFFGAYKFSLNVEAFGDVQPDGYHLPLDFNNSKQVVYTAGSYNSTTACLWVGGIPLDLNLFMNAGTPQLVSAQAITPSGKILCQDIAGHTVILTPEDVPAPKLDPSSLAHYQQSFQILIGLTGGGDGIARLPNGTIVHIQPGGPGDPIAFALARLLTQLGSGFELRALAAQVQDTKMRGELEATSRDLLRKALSEALAAIPAKNALS